MNASHPLEDGYVPELAEIENNYYFDARAVGALQDMLADGRKEGLDFWVCSAYRTIEKQTELYEDKVRRLEAEGMSRREALSGAAAVVAYPGTSEHNLGLAVDIVARDYQLLDERQEETAVKLLLGRQVDGILIAPQNAASLDRLEGPLREVPSVFLGENLRDRDWNCVSVDNAGGAAMGVEHLYGLGHREILYFGRRRSTTHQLRAEGYLGACEKLGLTPRIFDSPYHRSSPEYGYQLAKELFERPIDYTAVLAATDSSALGLLQAADELGIRIPGDLSLVGFDNIPATALPRIELTTVEQPVRMIAERAVEILLDKIEQGTPGYVRQILAPKLVLRSSCRPLK